MIILANDFSVYPGGRTYSDGEYSAREFYDKFLDNSDENIVIDLDGTRGIASCFLDEIVKLTWQKIGKTIHFISNRKAYINEITAYKKKYEEYSKRTVFKGICKDCLERYFCDEVKRNLDMLFCASYRNNEETIKPRKENTIIMKDLNQLLQDLKNLTDEEKRALAEDKRFDELMKKIDDELEKIKRN